VHPAVLDAYLDGTMIEGLLASAEQALAEELHELEPEEAAVLAMLQQRLEHESAAAGNDLKVSRKAA
jgi:DNA topoisomerase-1